MAKGKHISLEDIASVFESERNACAAEEKMLELLQHLATCSECVERVKAHRRLEILLENWSPDLHGQAYRKRESQKQLEESRKANKTEDGNDEDDSEYEEDGEYASDYSDYNEDGEEDYDEDCDDDCGCGHNHEHNPYEN